MKDPVILQRDAVCAQCGKLLPAGTEARYYAEDKIYCKFHPKGAQAQKTEFIKALLPEAPIPPVASTTDVWCTRSMTHYIVMEEEFSTLNLTLNLLCQELHLWRLAANGEETKELSPANSGNAVDSKPARKRSAT